MSSLSAFVRSPICVGLFSFLSLIAFVGCGKTPAVVPKESEFDVGIRLLNENKCLEAVAAFDKAVQANASDVQAYFYRAEANRRLGKNDLAVGDYSEALRIDDRLAKENADRTEKKATLSPDQFAKAAVLLAENLKEPDKADQAIQVLTEAIRRNTKSAEAYRARAERYLKKGFAELAIDDLNEALALSPNCAEAVGARALAYRVAGKMTEALADARLAVRLDPKCGEAYRVIGVALASPRYSRPDQAIGYFEEAIRLNRNAESDIAKELAHAYFKNGEKLAEAGKNDDAKIAFQKSQEISSVIFDELRTDYELRGSDPRRRVTAYWNDLNSAPEVTHKISEAGEALEKGKYDEALRKFDGILRNAPQNLEALCGRGAAFLKKGNPVSAINDFDRAIRLSPTSDRAYSLRAEAAVMIGDYLQADRDATQAIAMNPASSKAFFQRAVADLRFKKYELALADLNESVRLAVDLENQTANLAQPLFAEIYLAWGTALLDARRWDAAVNALSKSLELQKENAVKTSRLLAQAYRERGFDFANLGQFDKAVFDLNTALKLNDMDSQCYVASGLTCCKMAQACLDRNDSRNAVTQWKTALAHFKRAIQLDPEQEAVVRQKMEAARRALATMNAPSPARQASL